MKGLYVFYCIVLLIICYSVEKLRNVSSTDVNEWYKNADILERIRSYTDVGETHYVQTEDGYILTIFQIPRKKSKGVILLQHPLFHDARIWVSQYNQSIAFIFWKAGYDVWLGNTRGNYFCKKHITLTTTDRAFWNFSFHEMGYYDNHAIIEYIKRNTSQSKIIFLGHSLGSTVGLVYVSTRPSDASRSLKVVISMAPVTHLGRGTSILNYIAPTLLSLQRAFNFLDNFTTVMGNDVWYVRAFHQLYSNFPCRRCLKFVFSIVFGRSGDEPNPDFFDDLLGSCCSEIPLKVHDHFKQIYYGGEFRMYSFGEEENLQAYGNEKPPFYPLEKIKVPVFLMYGRNDSIVCVEENEILYRALPEGALVYGKVVIEDFNHADFICGRNREDKVYKKILDLLDRIN